MHNKRSQTQLLKTTSLAQPRRHIELTTTTTHKDVRTGTAEIILTCGGEGKETLKYTFATNLEPKSKIKSLDLVQRMNSNDTTRKQCIISRMWEILRKD